MILKQERVEQIEGRSALYINNNSYIKFQYILPYTTKLIIYAIY